MLQLPKHSQAKNCITYSAATVEQTKRFHLPANEKILQSLPKDKTLLLVSFLFDIISLGDYAHLTFLTQYYLFLSLTYSFYRTVYEAVKLSSITFHNTLFLRVTYNIGLKVHTGKELIAAANLAQAD